MGDLPGRLVSLSRAQYPSWTVATEDRGEGIFLQLDEDAAAAWEARVAGTDLWAAHKEAHRRNYDRRFSETAEEVDPDSRFPTPRYWLVHTLAHVLIRELAMTCGYSAARLSERLYAWPADDGRPPAAGLLVSTTASDSDGTLGGLVALSERNRLARVMAQALWWATRCSSDPICATRTPRSPRTSCVARPATRVRWRRRPHASARTGSSTVGSSSTCPEAISGSSDPLPDPDVARQLDAMVTGTEVRRVADRLASGETLTSAVRAVDGDRRIEVGTLLRAACLEPASRAGMVGLLRAVEGSRSVSRMLDPRWTMPGHLARGGPLHSSITYLVARARHTVTCTTFNIQRSSGLWSALRRAARRPEVSLRVYLDTRPPTPTRRRGRPRPPRWPSTSTRASCCVRRRSTARPSATTRSSSRLTTGSRS